MNNVSQIKRTSSPKSIGSPARPARGRLREFYQCDFDIAGLYDPMIADAEILRVIVEVFEALQLEITIKVNHRQILDRLFAVAGVPDEKIRSISSAVDKLDKIIWADVKKEMVHEKDISDEVAVQIGEYVTRSGDISEMLRFLKSDPRLCQTKM
jgi:histidyl-tRNA synthetase